MDATTAQLTQGQEYLRLVPKSVGFKLEVRVIQVGVKLVCVSDYRYRRLDYVYAPSLQWDMNLFCPWS